MNALFLLPWLMAPLGAAQQAAEPPTRPNLLILLSDDLGYADLGCQGATDIPTPHIDSIAANGLRCTNGYVTGCVCSPTRGAMLTGRYQQRYGLDKAANKIAIGGLTGEEQTLAELLKPAGYVSAVFGKWHLGGTPEKLPEAQGFDEFCYGEPLLHAGSKLSIRRSADGEILRERPLDNITTVIGREVPAFIERNQARPWFAYVAFKAPHIPHQPPAGYVDKFAHIEDKERRKYCASIAAQDDTVGLILEALRKTGQEERTLVIFLSDNGGAGLVQLPFARVNDTAGGPLNVKSHGSSSNDPLRGAKGTLWEGGIRVPMLMQWKGKLPAGQTFDRPITQMDFGATFLAAAGVTEGLPQFDGVNVLPHLTGTASGDPHAALFWTHHGGQTAVRCGDWKLVRAKNGSGVPELYDLAADIGETKDLATEHPDKVKELQQRLDAWLVEVGHIAATDESEADADE